MRTNTLLHDSDDWHFISQAHFHCQCYCVSLCVQLVTSINIGASLRKHFTASTLITYFTTKSYCKKVIKGSNHILIILCT